MATRLSSRDRKGRISSPLFPDLCYHDIVRLGHLPTTSDAKLDFLSDLLPLLSVACNIRLLDDGRVCVSYHSEEFMMSYEQLLCDHVVPFVHARYTDFNYETREEFPVWSTTTEFWFTAWLISILNYQPFKNPISYAKV